MFSELEKANFDARGKIWTTLVEYLYMISYAKYQSCKPCTFTQEGILVLLYVHIVKINDPRVGPILTQGL
jgi:hypothetical protein